MWFVGHWIGMQVFKLWINECFWGYLSTILVTTILWIHYCNSYEFDKTLGHFREYFKSIDIPFQANHENSNS
jgi:hypothetical protein